MQKAGDQPESAVRTSRHARTRGLALAVTIAALALGGAAVALGASTPVVPLHGSVAGKGYSFWMERFWQNLFASGKLQPKPCETVTVGGQRVALLSDGAAGPGPYGYTCTEPVGRPVYLQGLSDECSTFRTDHNGFGTSPSQLKLCARKIFKAASAHLWVDGAPVRHFNRFVMATGLYPVHVPKHNGFGIKKPSGRSAAYGSGVLLSGLTKGTHTVWINGVIPSAKFHVAFAWTLHVR